VKNHLLSITNLIKIFDEQVVIKKISFSIKQNSILGILGKNGAGKTTLLGMLMGLIKPTSGEIKIFGKDIEKNRDFILKFINFQSPYVELPKKMTVEQNLFFYGRLYGLRDLKSKILKLSADLEIYSLLNKSYGSLSAGQKTKVNLCKALLNSPKLLLLDEPTASLDPETSIFIRDYLLEFKKKNNSSILITSHNLEEIQCMCEDIILLKSGEIASHGRVKDILNKNNHKSIMDFFLERA
jgi:ABC-2 type transport system ATP-binding protein